MTDNPRNLPHLFPKEYGKARAYKAKGGGGGEVPPRDKVHHGQYLHARLNNAVQSAHEEAESVLVGLEQASAGVYLTFRAAPGYELPLQPLESAIAGIEVAHVQTIEGVLEATVFVPRGKESFFANKIQAYISKLTKPSKKKPEGGPENESLIAGIDNILSADLSRLWSDDPRHLPLHGQAIWWEVWIRDSAREVFVNALTKLALPKGERSLIFPDRLVMAVYGTREEIDLLRYMSSAIAELRRHQETPHFFVGQETAEQREWSDDLLGRLNTPSPNAPAVCILDTGVSRAHPLLAPVLAEEDWHAYNPNWPKSDNRLNRAHGTAMAGLAAYGDLLSALEGNSSIDLSHCLESVRILPPGTTENARELYGAITIDAAGQTELAAPLRRRVFCLAVTTDGGNGKPSSWSAAVDNLAFGKLDEVKRLFIISAGNIPGAAEPCDDYIYRCECSPVQDPAQSWNGLVVGACTFLQVINDPTFAGWAPLAPPGEISPIQQRHVNGTENGRFVRM